MTSAQVAMATLIGVLLTAATVMFIFDDATGPAWTFTGFGLFGFIILLAMILSDSRAKAT